jgi:uncharacterized protein
MTGADQDRSPSVRRIPLLGSLAFAGAVLLAQPALAQPVLAQRALPACTGSNLLDELQGTDADAHARILATAAAQENAGALLWRIERDGTPASHLFGTVHLSDERLSEHSAAFKSALAGSRRLVLEIEDLSPNTFNKAFAKNRDLMLFVDGRRLDRLLDAEEFSKLVAILHRSGVTREVAAALRPWVASLMLALSDCEQTRVQQGALPLDLRLAREAQDLGIGVAGLETLDLQLETLASVPEADQLELLKVALRTYERIGDFLETTVQLYLTRQLGAIWPLQLELAGRAGVAPDAFSALERVLVATRNRGMREKALPYLEDGGAFIAVGALHLPGPQGLVSLLREAGYTVTAVE